MKFSAVVCSLAFTMASADVTMSSNSDVGRNLMSKARQLDNNNNYYSWIQNYSIKFDGCAAVPQFEREEGVRSNLLAKFKLCPEDKCGSCPNAGEYIVDMREFVESYQEAKEQANQATCENAEYECEYKCQNGQYQYNGAAANDDQYNYQNNNNNNNNNNDEYCQYQCLVDQGLGYCAQDEQQDNEVNMNELAECRAMNEDQQNNNGYYSNEPIYYVGAYCTSSGVYAGTFTDSACTKKAPSGTYEKYNYGYSLPSEPLVESGCISCKAEDENNNNNNNNNNYNNNYNNGASVSEFCEGLYEQAGRCEKNVKGTQYQDNNSCELIHKVIPNLNAAFKSMNGGPVASKVFAWIFGIATVFMGIYIYRLHKTVIRQKVDLNTLMGGPTDGVTA